MRPVEGGAAHGSIGLIILGLAISVPIIVWGSQLVIKLMARFPIIIVAGGMLAIGEGPETKALLDLADRFGRTADDGVHVLVVRPGQVRTRLSANVKEAPLTVNKDVVAKAVIKAVDDNKEIVWVPGTFRFIMTVLRHIPRKVFRKLPV